MSDVLNKKTVKELRSILRDHKKLHCKPYSKLNKEQLIERLEKIDMVDSIPISKPKMKSKPKTISKMTTKDRKKDLHAYRIQLKNIVHDIFIPDPNLGKKFQTPKSVKMVEFNKVDSKIEEITGKKNIVIGINETPSEKRKREKEEKERDLIRYPVLTKKESDMADKRDEERRNSKFFV